jgi:hypothetical protein
MRVQAGHAHCGMVASARWIADRAVPCLSEALERFPDYGIKVLQHLSLSLSFEMGLNKLLRTQQMTCVDFETFCKFGILL